MENALSTSQHTSQTTPDQLIYSQTPIKPGITIGQNQPQTQIIPEMSKTGIQSDSSQITETDYPDIQNEGSPTIHHHHSPIDSPNVQAWTKHTEPPRRGKRSTFTSPKNPLDTSDTDSTTQLASDSEKANKLHRSDHRHQSPYSRHTSTPHTPPTPPTVPQAQAASTQAWEAGGPAAGMVVFQQQQQTKSPAHRTPNDEQKD